MEKKGKLARQLSISAQDEGGKIGARKKNKRRNGLGMKEGRGRGVSKGKGEGESKGNE